MKVSKDRTTWISLGNWYKDSTRSIFALNSDVYKNTDTYKTVSGSGYRKTTNKQLPESRVLNVSGLILADDIETVRLREREIRSLLVGEELYFLDEHYNLVAFGAVPNINSTPGRGELNGRSSLVNFNINMIDPHFQSLARNSVVAESQASIVVDYDMDYATDTDYTIKFTCKSAGTVVTSLIDSLLAFSASKTFGVGDILTFSTENTGYVANYKPSGGAEVSILKDMTDAFFINHLVLTPGENTITMNSLIYSYFDVEVSYYGRTI